MSAIARRFRLTVLGVLSLCLAGSGCHSVPIDYCGASNLPSEKLRTNLPDYTIEPPDVLILDSVRLVPRPPYVIQPGDAIFIQATGTPDDEKIKGAYRVEPDGMVRLGASYGAIRVDEMTIEKARQTIESHLAKILKTTTVFVALEESAQIQQVRGEHLVTPDGTISLGIYGRVNVTGKTRDDAKKVVEDHLSKYFVNPKLSLDVSGYNSKVYYIIFGGGGNGDFVYRFPVTGNETVLDAMSQVTGFPIVSSTRRMWISRPAPVGSDCDQVFGIDWCGIVQRGQTATNYQLLPGDRIYVRMDPLIQADTFLAKIIAPIERVLGVTLLGNATIRAVNGNNNGAGGTGF
ncbi:MAG: polysaccharide biosynthesis/export family protein [Planctomycetes bacterium]|nr:polysaccharide biosynthesis/export family protein [Planctomycetota bacterium]